LRGGRLQISSGGGQGPNWLVGGRELAYINAERKLVVTEVNGSGQQLQLGQSRILFGGRALPALPGGEVGNEAAPSVYISADGKRIILAVPTDHEAVKPLTLITNWTERLNK
jgi:hypothetical protein